WLPGLIRSVPSPTLNKSIYLSFSLSKSLFEVNSFICFYHNRANHFNSNYLSFINRVDYSFKCVILIVTDNIGINWYTFLYIHNIIKRIQSYINWFVIHENLFERQVIK